MIRVPYEDILAKITQSTGVPVQEIEERVKQKLTQFSGLISQEGAAHIVANEMGVKVVEAASGRLVIKNILSGMRSVDTIGRVMNIYPPKDFQKDGRSGSVGNLVLADASGSIRVVGWGEVTRQWHGMRQGDVLKIVGGYVRENNGQKELHVNERSRLIVNPKDESVPEVVIDAPRAQRKPIAHVSENDADIELLGVIVQAFEPKFFEVCPSCAKRVQADTDGFVCSVHGRTQPQVSYVASVVLDDGSQTMRISCFREQVVQLLGVSDEEVRMMRSDPQRALDAKQAVVGKMVSFVGRARRNAVLDRVEFVANMVNMSPDPVKELHRLESEQARQN